MTDMGKSNIIEAKIKKGGGKMAKAQWMAQYVGPELVKTVLPVRARNSHKGDFGRVLLLCGSTGLTGAAVLAAKAAVRAGSGLVYLGVPERVYPICAAQCLGPVVFPLACDGAGRLSLAAKDELARRMASADAVLLGPGLGRSEELTALVRWVLSVNHRPLVLDADGINALEGHIDILRGAACPVIVTPHDGEFLRLGGDPMAHDRIGEAKAFAARTGCILLLKGHRTIITDGENTYLSAAGNPGMATGGTGDVLSGVIVSLLGQSVMPLEAAACAAWIHGSAGDLAAAEIGEYGLAPGDLLERIPRLLR